MKKIIKLMATAVLFMALFGIVVVASATEKGRIVEFSQLLDSLAVKQIFWLVFAVAAGMFVLRVDYNFYKRPEFMVFLYVVTVLALILVYIPGIGVSVNGSHRWFRIGPLTVQPSEFAKVSMLVLVCAWVNRAGPLVRRFKEGILIPGVLLAVPALLIVFQKDVGATAVLVVVCGAVLFVAGANLKHLAFMMCGTLAVLVVLLLTSPALAERVIGFLNAKYAVETTLFAADKEESMRRATIKRDHVEQAMEALRNGGTTGVGYMNSEKKRFYLREAHTDFIAAIVGEEFGFVGGILLLLGYGVILVCGMLISLRAPDCLGRNLAFGLTFLLVFQSAINLSVVTDMLPTKGIALPFISYGGTSRLVSLIAVAVILNVGHQAVLAKLSDDANVFRDAVKI